FWPSIRNSIVEILSFGSDGGDGGESFGAGVPWAAPASNASATAVVSILVFIGVSSLRRRADAVRAIRRTRQRRIDVREGLAEVRRREARAVGIRQLAR